MRQSQGVQFAVDFVELPRFGASAGRRLGGDAQQPAATVATNIQDGMHQQVKGAGIAQHDSQRVHQKRHVVHDQQNAGMRAPVAGVVGGRVPHPQQNFAGLAFLTGGQVLQGEASARSGWGGGEVRFVDTAQVHAEEGFVGRRVRKTRYALEKGKTRGGKGTQHDMLLFGAYILGLSLAR